MASQPPLATTDQGFCRSCGKPIEPDARFCRFCGKAQTGPVPTSAQATRSTRPTTRPSSASRASSLNADGLEQRLRQLFPRHHLQDEFMHIATIAAFFMALIGFVLGFFPAYSWLADNFLFGAIALILFLILRESTLSHIRARGGSDPGAIPTGGRYQSSRPSGELPAEATTTQSSPRPSSAGTPASGSPPRT